MGLSILRRSRKEKVTYWPPAGRDDEFGKATFGPPRELLVRWEDSRESVTTGAGDEVTSNAIVMVGEDLDVDANDYEYGVMWRGPLARCVPGDPFANYGARVIIKIEKIPTLNYRDSLRLVYL
jgi:hypothetical protein